MLIFLYGADTFRLNRKLKQIIAEHKNRAKSSDFLAFDAADECLQDFFRSFGQNSLFCDKKFFVVKNSISGKEFKEAAIERVKEMAVSPHNILFCQEGKVLKADRFLKAILKYGQAQEFAPLEGARLEQWITAEVAALGRSEGKAIAPLLARRIGNDLWRMDNELQKLHHFAAGRVISAADIEKNISGAAENNIFATVDAIATGGKSRAIAMIKRHIAAGDHPLYLLAMIAAQFKNLFLIKMSPAASARRLGVHPYVFSKTSAQARQFDVQKLRDVCHRIRQADFDIKTGKVDAAAGLDLLIAKI